MNILEFAQKLKNQTTREIKLFGEHANSTINKITGRNNLLKQSYSEIQKQIKQLDETAKNSRLPEQIRAARREQEKLQRQSDKQSGKKSGGGMMGMMGGAKGLALGAALKAGEFLTEAVSKSLERQQMQTNLNVLAGGEQKGSALTKQLVDLRKNTILGKEVFTNAQTMMEFGFDSTAVVKNLKMLGDVSMGSTDRLQTLTLAYSQIRATGKLTENNLQQLVSAGFNPLEQISSITGTSMETLWDEMSRGNISFKMVQQAFENATGEGGKFNKMLEKIAETPVGKMALLAGAWDEIKIKAGNAFMPLLTLSLDLINKILPLIEPLIEPIAQGIRIAADWIAAGMETFYEWVEKSKNESGNLIYYFNTLKHFITERLVPTFAKVYNMIMKIVGGVIDFLANSELLRFIFNAIYVIVDSIFDTIGYLADTVSWIFDNVIKPILNGINQVFRFIAGKKAVVVSATSTQAAKPEKPETPETDSKSYLMQLLAELAQKSAGNNKLATDTSSEITGGGPKIINITISKFLDSIIINSASLNESAENVERRFREMFGRVVAQGAVTL